MRAITVRDRDAGISGLTPSVPGHELSGVVTELGYGTAGPTSAGGSADRPTGPATAHWPGTSRSRPETSRRSRPTSTTSRPPPCRSPGSPPGRPSSTTPASPPARPSWPTAPRADEEIARLYERSFVLVRPDGHAAWRGDELPGGPAVFVSAVRGDRAEVPSADR